MDVNKVTLIGNLVRDPAAKSLPSGQALTAFDLATTYSWQDLKTKERKQATEYHNLVAWGKLGEIIARYVKKGSKVYVEGRLRRRSWTDRTGKPGSRTEIIAENLIMLGHRARAKDPTELTKEEPSVEELPVAA